MDTLEAAPRLFCRCRPPFSAGASAAGAAAPPNENTGAEVDRDVSDEAVTVAPVPLPKAVLPLAPNVKDGGAEMEGVEAALPPGSLDAGLPMPKEKPSGAGPEAADVAAAGAAAPNAGAGAEEVAGAASAPPAARQHWYDIDQTCAGSRGCSCWLPSGRQSWCLSMVMSEKMLCTHGVEFHTCCS